MSRRSPRHTPQPKHISHQNPTNDNVYEVPLGDAPPFVAPTYEIPTIGTSKTISLNTPTGTLNGRQKPESGQGMLNVSAISPQAIPGSTRRQVLPSISNRSETSPVKPQLPAVDRSVSDTNGEYYDHMPLGKPMVTVWWGGRLRLEINFYLAIALLIILTLLAIGSTIAWISLLVMGRHNVNSCAVANGTNATTTATPYSSTAQSMLPGSKPPARDPPDSEPDCKTCLTNCCPFASFNHTASE